MRGSTEVKRNSKVIPDTASKRQQGQGEYEQPISTKENKNREAIKPESSCTSNIWSVEPSVGRVANGIPNRVDRLKGLGNAIVPQVVFEIFKAINKYEKAR